MTASDTNAPGDLTDRLATGSTVKGAVELYRREHEDPIVERAARPDPPAGAVPSNARVGTCDFLLGESGWR